MCDRDKWRSRASLSRALVLAASFGLIWVGCSDSPTGVPRPLALEECGASHYFRSDRFRNPTRIDNRWFPLIPGTQAIFDGVADRGGGLLPHRIVFTVTDLTKEILGVRTVVLWDRDYNNGQLEEEELAFFAQDDDGNVWAFGEYPEEYERGEFIGAPTVWIAGKAGAEPGIHMLGRPRIGASVNQGYAPEVGFLDCATVSEIGASTCVPYNCFENVLVTDERAPYEIGSGIQRKYYAEGIGNIRVGAVGDPEAETLVLISVLQLNELAMAAAREQALRLEARAYQMSGTYRGTAPLQRVP